MLVSTLLSSLIVTSSYSLLPSQSMIEYNAANMKLPSLASKPEHAVVVADPTFWGPFVPRDTFTTSSSFSEESPSVAESDVSSIGEFDSEDVVQGAVSPRIPLQWVFKGLTLWLEYEQYDNDLTKAIEHAVRVYGTERIPVAHSTAIYGMTHLSEQEAIGKLAKVSEVIKRWPDMDRPQGVTQDIAQEGRPGQVCSIAWAELTLSTNNDHERALDELYKLFDVPAKREGSWTPHISLAYDNPENTILNLPDTFSYVMQHPSLMKERRVKAISLWNTEGKMANWQCLDRVFFTNP